MSKKAKAAFIVVASILLISTLFSFLYYNDNKYQNVQPYTKNGVLTLHEQEIKSDSPIFLIDDWEFYADKLYIAQEFQEKTIDAPHYLFIGQYPNFSLINNKSTPDKATYRLQIKHSDSPQELFMTIPEIFTKYQFFVNGEKQNVKTGDILSLGASKDSEIIIWIEESAHYYDGLYYPPAVGNLVALERMNSINRDFYMFMFAFALTIFFFAITLRRNDSDHVFDQFALLCLCFALYCLYPFLHIHANGFQALLYSYEDVTYYLMCALLLNLCATLANINRHKIYRYFVRWFSVAIILSCILFPCFLLPQHKELVNSYGALIDTYKWVSSLTLLYCSIYALKKQNRYAIGILAGGSVFAASQLFNFFFNNLYEPMYGLWQAEYGAFMILLIFFALVLKRNRFIMSENVKLTQNLEKAVEQRTKDITKLLEERKAFFSDIAHDLKAPLSAIQNYTQLIEQNDIQLDQEIHTYINSIERKNQEMSERLLAMNRLTQVDKYREPLEAISINACLKDFYEDNLPEADALGIHFQLSPLLEDVYIYAQKEKIIVVLENLFYNALSFTSKNGRINIEAASNDNILTLTFKDNGCGIEPQHLPHIFERFYSKRKNKHERSGLGLYIVNMIITELGGTIHVESEVKKGTTFVIQLPCISASSPYDQDDSFTLVS